MRTRLERKGAERSEVVNSIAPAAVVAMGDFRGD